jgi:hypothetical protein
MEELDDPVGGSGVSVAEPVEDVLGLGERRWVDVGGFDDSAGLGWLVRGCEGALFVVDGGEFERPSVSTIGNGPTSWERAEKGPIGQRITERSRSPLTRKSPRQYGVPAVLVCKQGVVGSSPIVSTFGPGPRPSRWRGAAAGCLAHHLVV